jgi:hypothetical protein
MICLINKTESEVQIRRFRQINRFINKTNHINDQIYYFIVNLSFKLNMFQ